MRAWQLLSKRGKWCQGTMAQDEEGWDVDVSSTSAVKFCTLGAIEKCYRTTEERAIAGEKIDKYIASRGKFEGVVEWNDYTGRRKATIVRTLKRLHI